MINLIGIYIKYLIIISYQTKGCFSEMQSDLHDVCYIKDRKMH